ncbi:MAG: alanine racemase [Desulfovibrionaceae bacterium]
MPHLLVNRQALEHNLRTVSERCRTLGADFMLVFKEAGIRPDLLKFMLDCGFCSRAGFCHFPGVSLHLPVGVASHLLYLVPDSAIPEVVSGYDVLYQTGIRSLQRIAKEARRQQRILRVVLPVEVGDGRDGVLPGELELLAVEMSDLAPHVELWGLAANFACISEQPPKKEDLLRLLALRHAVQERTGRPVPHISVGGSDILLLGAESGLPSGITEIRCGTAVYLGVYPLSGQAVPGLSRTAVRLCGQIIECSRKNGMLRAVFDFGTNDTNPELVTPPYPGMLFQGASSGYSIFDISDCPVHMHCGDELLFELHHRSLARALATPRVPLCLE